MAICPIYKGNLINALAGKTNNVKGLDSLSEVYYEVLMCDGAECEFWNEEAKECGVKAPWPYQPGE